MVLGQARITDEGIAQLKTRVGSYFKGSISAPTTTR